MLADFQMDVHVAWRKRFGSPHLERRLGNEFGVELRILPHLKVV